MKRCLGFWVFLALMLLGCDRDAPPPAIAAPVAAPDVTLGKRVAASCFACHGGDGVNARGGAPFIAGQPAEYLLNALRAYAKGDRDHEAMKTAVAALNEVEIKAVAGYYAGLTSPWKAARPRDDKLLAEGKAASKACQSCHGADGNSTRAATPSLAGLPRPYIESALHDYFSGKRRDPVMGFFKHALDAKTTEAIAAYFAAQRRVKSTVPSQGGAAAGKVLAARCAGCHGRTGSTPHPAMPSLAGHNAEYLFQAVTAYRDGLRRHDLMRQAVAGLSDKQARELAAYYASQPPLLFSTAGGFDPLGEAERIASSCSACHGGAGEPALRGVPALAGLHPVYLASAIKAYRDGERKHAMMNLLVAYLSDADIEKLSFYFAGQTPSPVAPARTGDAAAGEVLSVACSGCHGERGVSTAAGTPSLAGQDALYFAKAMQAYAGGERELEEMQNAVKELSPQAREDLAAYFAAQPAPQLEVKAFEAPEILAQKCDRCHGERGYSRDPAKPRLAGQAEVYLLNALQAYKNGTRVSSAMHAMSDVLRLVEMQAIAAYYARQ